MLLFFKCPSCLLRETVASSFVLLMFCSHIVRGLDTMNGNLHVYIYAPKPSEHFTI